MSYFTLLPPSLPHTAPGQWQQCCPWPGFDKHKILHYPTDKMDHSNDEVELSEARDEGE